MQLMQYGMRACKRAKRQRVRYTRACMRHAQCFRPFSVSHVIVLWSLLRILLFLINSQLFLDHCGRMALVWESMIANI